jgi:hypothetical protein
MSPVALRERSNYIGIGKESTWGTSVARTDFIELRESDLSHRPLYGFAGGFRSASRLRRFKIKDFAEGALSADLLYDGLEKFFENVFGAASGATTGSAATGYTHTFDGKDAIPSGLTVEVDKDQGVYITKGAELSRMRIALDARSDKPSLVEFGTVAREQIISGAGADAPSASVVYPSPIFPVLPNEAAVVFAGGDVTAKVNSLELILDNQYDNDRRSLGSTNILQPTRTGPRIAQASLVAEFHADADFVDKAKTGLLTSIVLTCTSVDDIPGATPGTKHTLIVTLDDCFVMAAPVPVTGFGRLMHTVTIEAIEDTAVSPLTAFRLAVKNASSAI